MPDAASLTVSKKAIDMIVTFEIGSKTNYKTKLERPIWPGGSSGVTIGIGYDLGFNSQNQIRADWGQRVSDGDLAKLLTASKVTGQAAKALVGGLQSVRIPLDDATAVFQSRTLPRFARDTRTLYPGIELLPADAQGALLSLVFNRGTSTTGDRRREMKAIKAHVVAKDLAKIADEIVAMKRLWIGAGLDGLLRRRDDEARLVRTARTTYPADELVDV
jgi:hypothetical protein